MDVDARQNLKYDRVVSSLFEEQLDFHKIKGNKKLAVCSRRAGKTNLAAKIMIDIGRHYPNQLIPYITLTIKNAKRIIWTTLEEINREYGLEMEFRRGDITVSLTNGACFILSGAEKEDIDKLRGPKYPVVIIDECQSIGSQLKTLIDDVIEPATLDFNGQIIMFGTPNASSTGYFHDASTQSNAWIKRHWTLLDNPHLPHAKKWLNTKKEENSWDESTPIYRREYKGEWVRDTESSVYHFHPSRNLVDSIPDRVQWNYLLGIDIGFEDDTSFTVVAYSDKFSNGVYIVESRKYKHLITDDIAAHIKRLNGHYDFQRKVADTGGLGKMIVVELNRRFQLGITAAEKRAKLEFISLMNADFQKARLKIVDNDKSRDYIDELLTLEWDVDKLTQGRYVEKEGLSNHCTDSALYAWRESRHFQHIPKEKPPEKGSDEYYKAIEDKLEQEAEAELTRDEDEEWWEK